MGQIEKSFHFATIAYGFFSDRTGNGWIKVMSMFDHGSGSWISDEVTLHYMGRGNLQNDGTLLGPSQEDSLLQAKHDIDIQSGITTFHKLFYSNENQKRLKQDSGWNQPTTIIATTRKPSDIITELN